ncbi:cytidylyltransferase domain-containing protein [Marinomonas mediterranea]|jgi:CMP-N-acetylneuraminic acid synthetase|uniref:N-acylneuraminate cytidylyltransferase n=1 Tax=Marinomonas mediterranea (strain ATCC 700492 / JCM 21426 / NBRC 103028 / MMB-1) TaxID=717774 RepID=F2K155_MARM1|nr:acylneuraminate cytidylyltransferase family protein [Marinomonas mediterranea]ADZ89905.1 N-acylneuraminate cytidylyltransferase [Marinomonas mediterranea MMB-1]WCN07989.1 acylneuraminate cytidylyltransferase family protein [Marinomonas mediterranea]WCN12084.1 acylneuraminate cytidylyltransferase family protein [Marinomonas mediterranea]WCN16122.1 acylneuraminate cytidylyltransferase family protein [Marinomonas mediterranea MMB-1]
MKNLVIIPARGGSKGIPRKNVRIIAGKPLIKWSIEHALDSGADRVLVSTDDDEIAEVALKSGAEVPFLRPSNISGDLATTESALIHALEWLEENENYVPDNVILLQATSPIRKKGAIDEAVSQMLEEGGDSLLSVSSFEHFLWRDKKLPIASYDFKSRPRRQDLDPDQLSFVENGSIYVTKLNVLMANKNRLGGKICLYVMDDVSKYEIDTQLDWVICESILTAVGSGGLV